MRSGKLQDDSEERENVRIAALERYLVLDTPVEKQFDDLVKLAGSICNTPIALISLVDRDRQWFKAKTGIDAPETPRSISACQYAIQQPEVMEVPDTLLDARFVTNPLVTGDPNMRFYAGAPLTTPAGERIGTVCVLDTKPRELSEEQRLALTVISDQIMTLLELRLALRQKTEAEWQGRLTEARLNLIIESAQDYAIVSMSEQGVITSWSNGAELIFGHKAEYAIGKHISLIFTEEDRAAGIPQYEMDTAAKYSRASDERWHVQADGTRFYASGIMASMTNDAGNPAGFVKIARNMTEERNYQEALMEARNASEAANIAKTEFLANMSHEIRTPMNAIIGLSTILSMSSPLSEKQRQFVKTLQMSADSLLALINDLLDISKIEARSVELEQIPFSITQLIQEVISMMAVRVKENGLTFTAEGDSVKHRIFIGDPTRLRQVILNLCSNAIKFTQSGAVHVSITCSATHQATTETVCIAVTDTGIGIAADKLETIFEKFVQADTSISRKYGGTGLGLAITKTITEIMGGTITVDSTHSKGSTFTVCVPLKLATDDEIKSSDYSLSYTASQAIERKVKPHVLLVEDYAPNILVATTILEEFGFIVDSATDGAKAIEMVKSAQYIVALMDVQMHGMNGLDATQAIREHEKQNKLPRLPIIGMTAHALVGDRERCLGAGMDDYMAKPFNPDELHRKLNVIIDGGVPVTH